MLYWGKITFLVQIDAETDEKAKEKAIEALKSTENSVLKECTEVIPHYEGD